MNQSNNMEEQKFGQLVESIKYGLDLEYSSLLTSFYSVQDKSLFLEQETPIEYEIIQNRITSNFGFSLLKIRYDSQLQQNSIFCIITDFEDQKLLKSIQNHIIKFTFKTYFFDFSQINMGQEDSLKLSDSFIIDQLQQFQRLAKTHFQELRLIIFAETLNQKILKIIENFPFIYYFQDLNSFNLDTCSNHGLHQTFQQIQLQYDQIRPKVSEAFSCLKDLIFVGISIESKSKDNNLQFYHPIQQITFDNDLALLQYNIPFIYQNQNLYLPLPVTFNSIEIKDAWEIKLQKKLKIIFDDAQQIKNYYENLEQLNVNIEYTLQEFSQQLNQKDVFFSIYSEEEMFSLDSIKLIESVKDMKNFNMKQTYTNQRQEFIEQFWNNILKHEDNYEAKQLDFLQLQHSLLYGLKSQNNKY